MSKSAGDFAAPGRLLRVAIDVNGKRISVEGHPMDRLLDVLRERLHLTGTKEGCGEGECGACTVLLDGEPVLSCLVPLCQCQGKSVVTVEGLTRDAFPDWLDKLIERGGVQCGACTPGIVVTATALLERKPRPDRAEVAEALAGNLCRCTGYEGIHRCFDAEEDS